jgi:hypothetical protein
MDVLGERRRMGEQLPNKNGIVALILERIAADVRAGKLPKSAADELIVMGVPRDQACEALQQYNEMASHIRTLREPPGAVDKSLEGGAWYLGPRPGDRFWPAYRASLLAKGWSEQAIHEIDTASTKIVSLLQHPGAETIRTRGLVVGHVQSGKTANYTAVIAKAADAGYRFFLVLSGLSNVLRNQTQRRLDEDLGALGSAFWVRVTEESHDFRARANVNVFLTQHHDLKVLGVVKKNAQRLRRLLSWLSRASSEVLRACPILVIDDEADQASPNAHEDPEQRTAINALLINILGLPKAAYIGYTATPFANVLIDPQPGDLYPRDFIIALPRDEGYFGTEEIFGRDPVDGEAPDAASAGLDMIRTIPENELPSLQVTRREDRDHFAPTVTSSLADALNYFWMATAARRARRQLHAHSTMLVHTSQYTAVHQAFKPVLQRYLDGAAQRLRSSDAKFINGLREFWDLEQAAVSPAAVGEQGTGFDELLPLLLSAVEATKIVVENAPSRDRIDYSAAQDEPGRTYIVVGGNVLSRGLTLEGLCVSFFLRTASAYDTLLQMGRWSGYWRGYADLPRIWMTDELRGYFYDIATVEREIRMEIQRYTHHHLTPLDVGVRIRTHPDLAITSALKMQHAVPAEASFAGTTPQTTVFEHEDAGWLRRNLAAGRTLVSGILAAGIAPSTLQDRPHLLFKEVAVSHILDFLADYQIHEHHVDMRGETGHLLQDYIRAQNVGGRIKLWNVGIVTRSQAKFGTIDLGLPQKIALINRSRFMRGDPRYADVKALMSQIDPALDVDRPSDELQRLTRDELLDLRDSVVQDRALLLLYPISRASRPDRDSAGRKPLDAVEDVLGIALVFPDAEDRTPQRYMTADLSGLPREYAEEESDPD